MNLVAARAQECGVAAAQQMGGGGGQDVASVKCGRDDRTLQRRIGDLPDPRVLSPPRHPGEQTVVGQDEPLVREAWPRSIAARCPRPGR